MASFSPKKIDLSQINQGQQYQDGQGISTNAINAPIEASAYVQALATTQPDVSNANNTGTPKVSIVEENGSPKFKFENLKGARGIQGPVGPQGEQGLQGEKGPEGPQGAQGKAGTIEIGVVSTGAAGTNASVTNVGTPENAILNFVIPQGRMGLDGEPGQRGPQGEQGIQGPEGPQGDPAPASKIAFGTCSTVAGTKAKVVTLDATQSERFELVVGQKIAVVFTDANTASSPTLNVNGTGAKTIMTSYFSSVSASNSWTSSDTCEFMYDGSSWIWMNTIPYAVKSTTSSTTSGTKGAVRIRVYNGNLYIHTS